MNFLSTFNNILIIKLSSIGDVISITPCIYALKKYYPKSYLAMIVEEESYDIVRNNPYLDKIFIFKRTKLTKNLFHFKWNKILKDIISLVKQIREIEFDIAIDFQGLLRSVIFLYLVKAKYKVVKGKWWRIDKNIIPSSTLAVNGYLEMLKILKIDSSNKKLEVFISAKDEEFASKFFLQNKIEKKDLVVILNPSTRWQSKTWPVCNFIKLAQLLINSLQVKIVLTGSKNEIELSNKIQKAIKGKIYLATGKTTLLQLAALIKRGDIFITADTGPMHIAYAMGTKIIALFGPTDPQRTGPLGEGHIIIRKNLPCSPCFKRRCKTLKCMKAITPEEIMKIIKKFCK